MACFIVPAAEAAVTKAIEIHERKKEEAVSEVATEGASVSEVNVDKIPLSRKLKWLTGMLVGGSVLLMFEHIWHGEVVAWFPFLTAAAEKTTALSMLHEMATAGVLMAVSITLIWIGMCKIADRLLLKDAKETPLS